MKKTTAALAIAALAAPAAAQAHKPENDGTKNAAERQERNEQRQQQRAQGKQHKSKKAKGVGFAVSGLDYKGAAPTSSKESQTIADFTLDITSANRHARRYLGLTTRPSKETPAQDKTLSDTVDQKAVIRLVGFDAGQAVGPEDRVKVIGRVTRVKKDDTTTERKLDIRRIVIKDVTPQPAA